MEKTLCFIGGVGCIKKNEMKKIIWVILSIYIFVTSCSEFDPSNSKGFYGGGKEFKKSLKGVENKTLSFYPEELDSIIDVKLFNLKLTEKYEKVGIIVYHPAVKSSTETGGNKIQHEPYVDTTQYIANVKIKTEDGEEEWVFAFDIDLNYQWEMKR